PDLLAGARLVGANGVAPRADDLFAASHFDDQRRAEGEFLGGVGVALVFPEHLARAAVQPKDERFVAAVAAKDQHAIDQDWRPAVAVDRSVVNVRVIPEYHAVAVHGIGVHFAGE